MFAVQAIPAAAQARCVWILVPQTGTLNHLGTNYVTETPVTNTCQNNRYYSSDFESNVIGWRASVWIQNDGAWTGHFGGRNLASVRMEYYDANSYSLTPPPRSAGRISAKTWSMRGSDNPAN